MHGGERDGATLGVVRAPLGARDAGANEVVVVGLNEGLECGRVMHRWEETWHLGQLERKGN